MRKNTFYAIQFILIILLVGIMTAQAQNKDRKPYYIINGDKLEKVEENALEPLKTSWTISIKDSIYPVWKGTKGGYFIIRTSKKTGKEYRQYIEIENPLEEKDN